MLREPQHERKLLNHFRYPPFVLSDVEGLLKEFFNDLLNIELLNLEPLACTKAALLAVHP
jgi:hypothetical protein